MHTIIKSLTLGLLTIDNKIDSKTEKETTIKGSSGKKYYRRKTKHEKHS